MLCSAGLRLLLKVSANYSGSGLSGSRVIWLLPGISRTSSTVPKFGLGVTPVVFPLEFLLEVQH
jgi:hypothetical protein